VYIIDSWLGNNHRPVGLLDSDKEIIMKTISNICLAAAIKKYTEDCVKFQKINKDDAEFIRCQLKKRGLDFNTVIVAIYASPRFNEAVINLDGKSLKLIDVYKRFNQLNHHNNRQQLAIAGLVNTCSASLSFPQKIEEMKKKHPKRFEMLRHIQKNKKHVTEKMNILSAILKQI